MINCLHQSYFINWNSFTDAKEQTPPVADQALPNTSGIFQFKFFPFLSVKTVVCLFSRHIVLIKLHIIGRFIITLDYSKSGSFWGHSHSTYALGGEGSLQKRTVPCTPPVRLRTGGGVWFSAFLCVCTMWMAPFGTSVWTTTQNIVLCFKP